MLGLEFDSPDESLDHIKAEFEKITCEVLEKVLRAESFRCKNTSNAKGTVFLRSNQLVIPLLLKWLEAVSANRITGLREASSHQKFTTPRQAHSIIAAMH
jgi:hypothetical protein